MRSLFVAVAVVSGVGCDFMFRLDHVDVTSETGADATAPSCAASSPVDHFDGTQGVCRPWGLELKTNADASEANGALTFTTIPGAPAEAACSSPGIVVAFADAGIFIEVTDLLLGETGVAALRLETVEDNGARLVAVAGELHVTPEGNDIPTMSAPYNATTMRWWRLRPDRVAGTIVGEYSANGIAWNELGEVRPVTMIPTVVQLSLDVTVTGADLNPTIATFHNLDICP